MELAIAIELHRLKNVGDVRGGVFSRITDPNYTSLHGATITNKIIQRAWRGHCHLPLGGAACWRIRTRDLFSTIELGEGFLLHISPNRSCELTGEVLLDELANLSHCLLCFWQEGDKGMPDVPHFWPDDQAYVHTGSFGTV